VGHDRLELSANGLRVATVDMETTVDGEIGSVEESRSNEIAPHGAAVGHSEGHPDAVEEALAEALKGATGAGRWDVVAQLARELEARRTARAGNVVDLAARKRGAR
jgi:hypothetical protein